MAPAAANSGSFSGTVQNFNIGNPDNGEGCRLKGIDKDSANYKNYASVPATDVDVNAACGRCVRITCDDDKCTGGSSVTAYVLEVSQSAKSGATKASKAALTELGVAENANDVKVSYKMVNCPSSLMSGNVKACLMEGASNTYIPLQFYNSQKVIKSVKINGVDGQQQKGSFQYNANMNQNEQPKSDWYGNVQVELTATDGDSQKATFAFGGPSGCASSDVQFAAASTSDALDGGKSGGNKSAGGSGSSTGTIIGAVCGVIGALVIIVGSIFYVRRRRAANDGSDDIEGGQYLSPRTNKPAPPGEPATHAFDAGYPSTPGFQEPNQEQEPVTEYNHASSPGAGLKAATATTTAAAAAGATTAAVAASSYSTPPPRESSPAPTPSLPLPASNYIHNESMSSDESYSFSSEVPKYSYSSDMKYSFSSNVSNTSPERPRPAAPMVPAPVVPATREAAQPRVIRTAESEERTSFDIDDMRSTEESFRGNSYATNDYSAAYNSSYASTAVTSPQSYVRATSLRRNSSRDQAPRNNGSIISDSSFVGGNAQFPRSSARDSSYSRDSLNILEYPYAKKNGRNGPNSG
ncbi:TPA: hypothetical protein N0F65_002093 [Lagenidium giganteum]|uniref:Expansin-like EG45 domain-containing protein n=1 Tax=Lagenidium giganteum TaxID=4803 RepID=A0AAV2ZA73_9STRA|nr:TPA: hypothetical protein N0F65_002093 [Lagenidium giganteum]